MTRRFHTCEHNLTRPPYKGVDVLLKAFAQIPASVAKEAVLEEVGCLKMPVEPLHSLSKQT